MNQPLLDMHHVEISYNNKIVVRDVNLQVQPGEILGIVGESGSGKSTLIRGVMGILGNNGAVTGGDIFYQGQNLASVSREELRQIRGSQMGMIFQNTASSLCPVRTIEEQLYECVWAHEKVSKQAIWERALELIDKMGLKDGKRILKSYPFELSGGMNQRVGILMAMIVRPKLLFADEPTSALDVTTQAQVIREMKGLRDTYQTAIAIVTHNIGIIEHMADKVAVMHQGQIVEYGEVKDILQNPQHEYTKQLLRAVLRIHKG